MRQERLVAQPSVAGTSSQSPNNVCNLVAAVPALVGSGMAAANGHTTQLNLMIDPSL